MYFIQIKSTKNFINIDQLKKFDYLIILVILYF